MAGLAEALDLLLVNIGDSKGFRRAAGTLASVVKDCSDELRRMLDDYTTRNPERKPRLVGSKGPEPLRSAFRSATTDPGIK